MLTTDEIMIEAPAEGQIIDPLAWFDTPGPLEIEIGCGKGGFLLHRARSRPDVRLLGIEWANKYFHYGADRVARWNLHNVRIMRTDARFFVLHHLPPACVSVLHLYHPDPWPKRRHHKRRLIRPDFVQAAARALQPGGYWLIQSDHTEYFELIRSVLGESPGLRETRWEDTGIAPGPDWAGTNFEIKFAREGHTIHRAAYKARGSPLSLAG